MKKKDILRQLMGYPDDQEIMILDGKGGVGYPRKINLGPMEHEITEEDSKRSSDCQGKEGQEVVVLGYRCS